MIEKKDYKLLPLFYNAFVNLYGVLPYKEVAKLVQICLPNADKYDVFNDLLIRMPNDKEDFIIKKFPDKNIIIFHKCYYPEQAMELLRLKDKNQEYYIPENFFNRIKEAAFTIKKWIRDCEPLTGDLIGLLKNVRELDEEEEIKFLIHVKRLFELKRSDEEFFKLINKYGVKSDSILASKMIGVFDEFKIYAKAHHYNGYSLREIW